VTLAGLVSAPSLALAGPVGRDRLRPPGALDEDHFASRCIRCGRCAAVCPYESIQMLGLGEGLHAATPIVEPVEVPCYMCMECVDVCPTRAIEPVEMEEITMGTAKVDREMCVAWNGTSLCRTCYTVCPLRDRAITNWEFKPEVVDDVCTGCGVCVHACPISDETGDRKAIYVDPPGVRS